MSSWKDCKNILCIRADNMGDLLMSSPAIHALKESLACKITLLTSCKAADLARLSKDIDEVIEFDLPWVKLEQLDAGAKEVWDLIALLKQKAIDACVVFTVYSQNPLPAVMLAYLAGIPKRLAYCRENPYALLTDWVPDPEPYEYIRHQVQRDLDLVALIGAVTNEKKLRFEVNAASWTSAKEKALALGVKLADSYMIIHPGVSEFKRRYPTSGWIIAARELIAEFGLIVLITGSAAEHLEAEQLQEEVGVAAVNCCGVFSIAEFAAVIAHAAVVISVNTGTVHLAAAVQTPVVVLHAQSNPQHTPWMVPHYLLEYSIPENLKSRNKVIGFVNKKLYGIELRPPGSRQIVNAVRALLGKQVL